MGWFTFHNADSSATPAHKVPHPCSRALPIHAKSRREWARKRLLLTGFGMTSLKNVKVYTQKIACICRAYSCYIRFDKLLNTRPFEPGARVFGL